MVSTTLAPSFVQCRKVNSSSSRVPQKQRLACFASLQPVRPTEPVQQRVGGLLAGLAAAAVALNAAPAFSAVRLPPLDDDPNRCDRAFVGNTIGQANAVSDKLLDLRKCVLKGANLKGKTLSGALLVDADLSGANMQEAVMSKAYAINAKFTGADLTNAVVDRVAFDGSDMSNTNFTNAVLTGTTWVGANMAGMTFEDALIGNEDVKRMCINPTLTGESRTEVGCRVIVAKK